MHHIAMETTKDSVRGEAVSIMNVIFLRSNTYTDGERKAFEVVLSSRICYKIIFIMSMRSEVCGNAGLDRKWHLIPFHICLKEMLGYM